MAAAAKKAFPNLSKRLNQAYEGWDVNATYSLKDAVERVQKNAKAGFDESIDVAIQLGIDPRQSDQNVRGAVTLPNGTGKTVRVAVFAQDDKAKEAKDAGADIVGADDLVEEIQGGNINFDRVVATPDMMAMVGKVAKVLGPKGLMPNPKLGTVTPDVTKAVTEAKAGQVQFKAEKKGIVHASVGKASFSAAKLEENIKTLIEALRKAKPSGVKGTYLEAITLTSTMGVGVKVDVATAE